MILAGKEEQKKNGSFLPRVLLGCVNNEDKH